MLGPWTAKDLGAMGLPGYPTSERGMLGRLKADAAEGIKRPGRGGGLVYPLAELSAIAQIAILDRHAETLTGEDLEGLPDEVRAVGLTHLARRKQPAATQHMAGEQGLVRYHQATKAQQAKADGMAAIVRGWIAYRSDRQGKIADLMHDYIALLKEGLIPLPEEAVQAKVKIPSQPTLYRWQRQFRESGPGGLLPEHGNAKRGTTSLTADQQDLAVSMMLDHPRCGPKRVREAMQARFGYTSPKTTIARYMEAWRKQHKSLVLYVTNPDAWRSNHMVAFGSLSEEITALNQRWEMDSTKADLMLADGKRHDIVGVIDIWSRRLKLLVTRTTRSTAVTALARNAMLDWGLPQQIKTDNGSDYVSKHTVRVFESLNIEQLICTPFAPEQKPHIERAFWTFSHGLLELLPGFVGHDITDRKAIESRKTFAQRLFGGDEVIDLSHMSAEDLQAYCDEWIENLYNHDVHSGIKQTPSDRVLSWPHPVARIKDERALDLLLAPAPDGNGTRRVAKKGLRIANYNYDAPALTQPEVMGQTVQVRMDEANIGVVYVFDERGKYICVAECPELLGVSRKERAMAAKRLQAKIYQQQRREAKALTKEMGTAGIAAEVLAMRAEAAPNITPLRPAGSHTTPALEQAGVLAKDLDRRNAPPPQRTQADRQAQQALVAELNAPKPAAQETADDRYKRAKRLERLIEQGKGVPREQETWLRSYQKTNEYKATDDIYASFG
ncbi:Mu transposase C-terminal domain-containing protein [Magnetococcus sp. PR-3]|uniref:Mu transposase C-terminal domain-containing protein n=1 Tax=Magnetococcus sp. PR-3 TaxID=3120355 RepID=UPI002FCDEED8